MADDELWTTAAIAHSRVDPKPRDKDRTTTNSATTTMRNAEGATTLYKEDEESGCFFIEDNFYLVGPVDYAQPILDWIDGYGSKPNPARSAYLGISAQTPLKTYKGMKDIQLGQVPFRLGLRYYHVCHGDVETSVMLTDRIFARQHVNMAWPPDKVFIPTHPRQLDAIASYHDSIV
jgi:hypothetical protein